MDFADSVTLLVVSQTILLPILGLLWYGARQEREHKERLLREALKSLQIVGISRGNFRR